MGGGRSRPTRGQGLIQGKIWAMESWSNMASHVSLPAAISNCLKRDRKNAWCLALSESFGVSKRSGKNQSLVSSRASFFPQRCSKMRSDNLLPCRPVLVVLDCCRRAHHWHCPLQYHPRLGAPKPRRQAPCQTSLQLHISSLRAISPSNRTCNCLLLPNNSVEHSCSCQSSVHILSLMELVTM